MKWHAKGRPPPQPIREEEEETTGDALSPLPMLAGSLTQPSVFGDTLTRRSQTDRARTPDASSRQSSPTRGHLDVVVADPLAVSVTTAHRHEALSGASTTRGSTPKLDVGKHTGKLRGVSITKVGTVAASNRGSIRESRGGQSPATVASEVDIAGSFPVRDVFAVRLPACLHE
jgi:hypothetical protein